MHTHAFIKLTNFIINTKHILFINTCSNIFGSSYKICIGDCDMFGLRRTITIREKIHTHDFNKITEWILKNSI